VVLLGAGAVVFASAALVRVRDEDP
jgi:hypothetical protein